MDTVVFEAAAHHLAFGPNVPVGHRIFFLDDGTVQLLMDKKFTTTNGAAIFATIPTRLDVARRALVEATHFKL